jgi:hypothetical protein
VAVAWHKLALLWRLSMLAQQEQQEQEGQRRAGGEAGPAAGPSGLGGGIAGHSQRPEDGADAVAGSIPAGIDLSLLEAGWNLYMATFREAGPAAAAAAAGGEATHTLGPSGSTAAAAAAGTGAGTAAGAGVGTAGPDPGSLLSSPGQRQQQLLQLEVWRAFGLLDGRAALLGRPSPNEVARPDREEVLRMAREESLRQAALG